MKKDVSKEEKASSKKPVRSNSKKNPIEITLPEESKSSKTIKLAPSKQEETAKEETKEKTKSFIKELIPYVIILIVVVLIRTFIATPVIVSGPSMKPTLNGGEIMILNKLSQIKRFDVVVIKVNQSNRKEEIIKRVIALPGETIVCENGIIYVNGIRQDEEYSMGVTNDFDLIKLADDEYFVMGDNREDSADSRVFGPFNEKDIKGTSEFVLFPFNKFGSIE